jgi:hypothetical protein
VDVDVDGVVDVDVDGDLYVNLVDTSLPISGTAP